MINIGDEISLKITAMSTSGEGIARLSDLVVFVKGALIGETVLAQITGIRPKFANAKTIKVERASEDRISPPCPYFGKCGGCDVQHLKYEKQLDFKRNAVEQNLKRIAKREASVLPVVQSKPFGYRNKLSLPICQNGVGMFEAGSHNVLPIKNCMLANEWNEKLITAINTYIVRSDEENYNFRTSCGNLRHVVARFEQGQLLVCLVVAKRQLKNAELLVELLKEQFDNFGLYTNLNTARDAEIMSHNFTHIYGLKEIMVNYDGIVFPVSVHSFMQVNSDISQKIYKAAADAVKGERVVNAYSGAGLLSALLAREANEVIGIEYDPHAHKNAQELKKKNHIENLTNICGKVEDELFKIKKFDAIVLDPPRKGCDAKVIEKINAAKPKRVVYISCDSGTLSRDLARLAAYKIISVQPWDMFPQTRHVETLVVLERE